VRATFGLQYLHIFASAATVVSGYLLGSIPAGYLAGRIAGTDIRSVGSGNIGATNVTRVLGARYGFPVFAVDFLKGLVAVILATVVSRHLHLGELSGPILQIASGVFCVIGHSFPVWLGFKGGKGVATSAGVLFGLMPLAAMIGLAIWFMAFWLTRYVSVASITAALTLPLVILVMTRGGPLFYVALGLAALVIFRHRSNLSRLVRGTEPRYKRK
jgi:glycerol-3-phosphate acyltransferase PlsY